MLQFQLLLQQRKWKLELLLWYQSFEEPFIQIKEFLEYKDKTNVDVYCYKK
jgi:hypothetical protein